MTDQYEFDFFQPEEMVQEFITAFDASPYPELWLNLINEELNELTDALNAFCCGADNAAEVLKEAADLMYVLAGHSIVSNYAPIDDELAADISAEFAWLRESCDPWVFQEAFILVHRSNMSKLGEDGKPVRRADGKILKGPNYKAPDLSALAPFLKN